MFPPFVPLIRPPITRGLLDLFHPPLQWVASSCSMGLGCRAGQRVNLCKCGHPKPIVVFPFVVGMNHEVWRTRHSVALITSPWGNVREGSNLLTRPWQAKDDDRKLGRDRSAAEQKPRPPCRIGRDACDQLSFPKVTLLIFSVFILIAVLNASSSSLYLKHGALRNRYVSLGIERQFFKMNNAWCSSISSRFSAMLSSTLIFAFKCSGADSWCRVDPRNCQWVGSGIERDGNWSWKSLLVWGMLMSVWLIRSRSHLEL